MASIISSDVTVRFPIYNSGNMSIRNQIASFATGGLLSKNRASVVEVTALDGISFQVDDGDRVGLIGHNGSGKSTLLRLLAGIYHPTSGSLLRIGKVSSLFELGAGIEPDLSGLENIVRLGMFNGLSGKASKQIVDEVVEFAELGPFIDLPVRTYSSGMVTRLMFAVCTSIEPEILLIDEFFGTGDSSFQLKARQRLEEVISGTGILFFASHSVELIKKYCTRAFQLTHGKLVEVDVRALI